MSPPPSYRRRQFVVHGFQVRMIVHHLAYLLSVVALLYLVVALDLMGDLEGAASSEERVTSARILLYLHHRVFPLLAGLALVTLAHSVLVSHRVAGPIYRFRQVFRGLRAGDLCVFSRIRRRDYLQDEAADLTAMVEHLRRRLAAAQASAREVRRLACPGPLPEPGRERLASELARLVELLDGFRTDPEQPAPALEERAADDAGGRRAA